MNVNARSYQEEITSLKVITYCLTKDLSNRLEADCFHDYKFNLDVGFTRELEKAIYSSSKLQHMNA
jgi:hypothetical protein